MRFLLLEEARVVAFEGVTAAVVELEDPACHVVEEVPIVGHCNDGAGVVLERALQPGDRLGVEMVGGLVEEEEVGLGEEETGHGDTSNLAAGKVLNAPVAGWCAEGVHRDLDRALEIPGTGGFDLGFEVGLFGTEFLVVSVGIAPGGEHLVVLGKHCRRIAGTVHHVFEDGLGRIELGFLLQHADRVALTEFASPV